MIIPPYLTKNDTIALAAPARKISQQEISAAVRWLKNAGFNVFYDDRLFASDNQFAGNDELRTSYFQELLDNEKINAIWCVRGGYGTARIIDKLNFTKFSERPKWICGYSDITVLHNHIHSNLGIATLHATMPIHFNDELYGNSEAATSLLNALIGNVLQYNIPKNKLSRCKNFSGTLVGGNLSVIFSLIGSKSDINTDDKVLLIEDLDEYLYHIDRMMLNLKRSGKLKNVRALLVGHLNKMHDNAIPFGKTAEEIVADYCKEFDFPVIFNIPAGHLPDNRAFRLGCEISGYCSDSQNFIIKNLT